MDSRFRDLAVIAVAFVVLGFGGPRVAAGQGSPLRAGQPQVIGQGYGLTHVGAAALGPRGLVAVAQPMDAVVLVFAIGQPNRPTKVLGRRGEGPGEFQTPGRLGWRGDTLWATDWGRSRVESFVAPEWTVASRVFGTPSIRGRGWRFRAPIGLLGDSTIVHYPSVIPAQLPATGSAMPVLLTSPDGQAADTLGLLTPERQHFCVTGDRNGGRATSCSGQPITADNFVSVGDDGRRLLLVLQAAQGVKNGSVVVRVVGADRRVIFERPLSLGLRAVSNSEWDSVLTAWARSYSQDVWSTEALAERGLRQALSKPATHPLVDQALVGRDGRVWVREAVGVRHEHRWHVLNRDGTTNGVLMLPSGLRLLDADRTQVIGVTTDRDGVETLLLLEVLR